MIGTATGFNFVVDPYGIWRAVEKPGFNAAKSERRNLTHVFKPADLRRTLPPNLILGSSRSAFGMNPEHAELHASGGAYNASLPGGHLTVLRQYLELAIAANPDRIHTVYFTLDFFEFSAEVYNHQPSAFSASRMRPDRPPLKDFLDTLLTFDALRASLDTIGSNRRDPNYQPFHANGQLTAIDMRNYAQEHGMRERFRTSLDLYLNGAGRFVDYQFTEAAYSEIEDIVATCQKNGISLVMIIPPTHAAHLEAIRVRGLWPTFMAWKRRLVDITPYWDFSGYNIITTEPVADEMRYYWDISHYRSQVGDLILDRVFGKELPASLDGFGIKTTVENIDLVAQQLYGGHAQWAATNAEIVGLVQKISDR